VAKVYRVPKIVVNTISHSETARFNLRLYHVFKPVIKKILKGRKFFYGDSCVVEHQSFLECDAV
jgi:hypothetical protein